MENIKTACIPIGQVARREYKGIKIGKFIKNNKLGLIFIFFFLTFFSIYGVLIFNFINLIKILN